MSEESGTTVLSALSPSKRIKISYTREFLLSLSKVDTGLRLPREVKLSLRCLFEDMPGLLSPPSCAPDSGCHKSVPQSSSMNILNNANHLLHRSSEPYRPPCRHKASPPSSRDGNGLLNSDSSGSSRCTNQEKAEGERWSKGMVTLPNEDIWYSTKSSDSQEYSEAFLMSPSTIKSNTLQSTLTVINQQSDASQKRSLVQGDAVQSSILPLPEITKGCSTQHHWELKSVNPWIAERDLSEASVLPEEKQLTSMVEKCESALDPAFQIQHDLELSSYSNIDGKSLSSFELCLPDEDSLISFDEQFLMPDLENSAVVDNSMSNPERNPIEVDSPSSPRVMVEKLVESILNDESCSPAQYPIVHNGAGLEGYCDPLHAQQSYTQFCSNQLNLQRDEQAHNSFQRSIIDPVTSHSFLSGTTRQPFPLSHEELRRFHDQLRRFDHGVSQAMFQQMVNKRKHHLCTLRVSQSVVTPYLPLQMSSCTQTLNSMQNCTVGLGCQEPCYEAFMGAISDSLTDGNTNQAVLDSLVETNLRARHWHPYVGGF